MEQGKAQLDLAGRISSSPDRVIVLTGPAGAGKTSTVLDLYRRRLDDIGRPGCLLIVPNALAVRQMRSRLLADSPHGVLVSPAVTTFASLASAVLSAAGVACRPLSAVQRRVLLEGIVADLARGGRLKALAPLADAPGLIDALDGAIAELKRAAVAPDALAGAIDPDSARHADLLAVYREYQRQLHSSGRYDLEGRMWLARDILRADPAADLGHEGVVWAAVDGFTDFTPTQLAILAALAGRLDKLVVTLPLAHQDYRERMWFWTRRTLERVVAAIPEAVELAADASAESLASLFDLAGTAGAAKPDGERALAMKIVSAPSVEEEVRSTARAVKGDLAAGASAGAVAVLARNLAPYIEPIERIFAEHDVPVASRPAPLSDCGVVRYILQLLALPPEYRVHDVLAVLGSSYFRPEAMGGGCDERTAAVAQMAIRAGNVLGGRAEYAQALNRLAALAERRAAEGGEEDEDDGLRLGPVEADGEAIRRAGAMIESLLERLAGLIEASDPAGYVQLVRALIEEMRIPQAVVSSVEAPLLAADLRALAAFDALLGELGEGPWEAGLGPAGLSDLVARCAAVATAPPAGGESLVTVADVLDARGLQFETVYLLGVNERAFPTLSSEQCFINEADRAAWALGGVALDRRSDLIAREMLLFYLAATRAGRRLTVSYLASDASGKAHSASHFVGELASAAERQGTPCERETIPPGRFALPARQLARADDAFNAAISSAFQGERAAAEATALLGWAGRHRGELLGRAAFGLLAMHRRWRPERIDAFDGRIDDPALLAQLAETFPREWIFSATELNLYARCPWAFFARYLLGLSPLVEPAAQMTPASRGVFCHNVLWRVMSELRQRGGGVERIADAEEAVVRAVLDEAVEAERARLAEQAVYSGLWHVQTQAWRHMLWEYLKAQCSAAGREGLYFELGFGLAGDRGQARDPAGRGEPIELPAGAHAIRVRGKIDRVDRIDAKGVPALLAVDYKTGAMPAVSDIRSGLDLQLWVYARVLAEMFELPSAGGAYHDVKGGGVRQVSSVKMPRGRTTYEEWLAAAEGAVEACVDSMRQGRFEALPVHGCSGRCEYRQICHYSDARARRKAPQAAGQEGEDE